MNGFIVLIKPTNSDSLIVSIEKKIAQALPGLTKSHQHLASYVLKNPFQVVTMPIDELSAAAGVSVATANRFARSLGFDGYASFRTELIKGFEPLMAPVMHMKGHLENPSTAAEVFAAVLEESGKNIDATRQRLDAKVCEQAVKSILQARRVYVLGLGSSAWLAGLLQQGLEYFCSHTQLLSTHAGVTHAVRCILHCNHNDMLIAIAFPRYLDDTIHLAEIAKNQGLKVLGLTDLPCSPLVSLADLVLYAQTSSQYRPNSETGVLALIEGLVSAVSLQAPDAVKMGNRIIENSVPWLVRDLYSSESDEANEKQGARHRSCERNRKRATSKKETDQ